MVAVNAFKRFLATENVSLEGIHARVAMDESGNAIVTVLDAFGMYLACSDGRNGKPLARHSVMSYFRQVKNWLLDQYLSQKPMVDERLLKMARMLERHCLKRETGGIVKKANACTKKDLELMMQFLYRTAQSGTEYQDAALLCLLWYLFGRASDVSLLQKQHMSVCARNVLFLRLVRVKTSEEQGLTLFPDRNFATCPILAVALALLMQKSPATALLDQLPTAVATHHSVEDGVAVPLVERLDAPETGPAAVQRSANAPSPPGIHNYVNRLLARIAKDAGVLCQLSSHSFRRGGAQHANGDAAVSAQWIFDRGAWNLSTTNKAFAYVFNTTNEDQKIAKVLSGWETNDNVKIQDLGSFDSVTANKIAAVQSKFFNACHALSDTRLNVCGTALDVLTAQLIRSYPMLKQLHSNSPAVERIEQCLCEAGCDTSDLLAWAAQLQCDNAKPAEKETGELALNDAGSTREMDRALLREVMEQNRLLSARLRALESAREDQPSTQVAQESECAASTTPTRKRKAPPTKPVDVWFEWHASEPRVWACTDPKKKSHLKILVGYMKLFLADGFQLHEDSPDYKNNALQYGQEAEANMFAYLESLQISSRAAGTVTKHMRALHRQGKLDDHIRRYRNLIAVERISDPAPSWTHFIELGST